MDAHRRKQMGARGLVGLVVTALALGFATTALGAIYTYQNSIVGPGGTAQTPNPQEFRQYNKGCRNGNSGQLSVRYYQGGSIIADSGVVWTNCGTGAIATLTQQGTYTSWCRHEGTVSWQMVCETTRP